MTWMGFIRDFYKEQTMKKLVIEHLKKTFDQKVVLEDIDYTFTEGKIYGLLGVMDRVRQPYLTV